MWVDKSIVLAGDIKAKNKNAAIVFTDVFDDDEERINIEKLEHRRWNAYLRSEGYVFGGSTDKSSRNDLAKMHHNLVDYSSLSEEIKRLDSKVGTK